VNWIYATITLISLVVSVVYATRLFKHVVFGTARSAPVTEDLTTRELAPIIALAVGTLLFGLLPQLLMGPLTSAVDAAILPAAGPAP
jgi:NADH-quinone oxidoreductase subunit M